MSESLLKCTLKKSYSVTKQVFIGYIGLVSIILFGYGLFNSKEVIISLSGLLMLIPLPVYVILLTVAGIICYSCIWCIERENGYYIYNPWTTGYSFVGGFIFVFSFGIFCTSVKLDFDFAFFTSLLTLLLFILFEPIDRLYAMYDRYVTVKEIKKE